MLKKTFLGDSTNWGWIDDLLGLFGLERQTDSFGNPIVPPPSPPKEQKQVKQQVTIPYIPSNYYQDSSRPTYSQPPMPSLQPWEVANWDPSTYSWVITQRYIPWQQSNRMVPSMFRQPIQQTLIQPSQITNVPSIVSTVTSQNNLPNVISPMIPLANRSPSQMLSIPTTPITVVQPTAVQLAQMQLWEQRQKT